ncbi:MAG: hypothetical protein D6776_03205 [Planctomycetota bacterium]|nr:MAG: hypothetical protein D6776_03205 [Planctomycetota bacterium]
MLIAVACVLAAPLPAIGDDDAATWPQWRGPTRDGQCAKASAAWPESFREHLALAWRVADLGPSYAGPIVAADRVFTVETRGKREEIVRAFDRQTGSPVWTARWGGSMSVPFFARKNGSWVRSTPAHDEAGKRLYVGGMRDVLVCLDAKTGDVVWRCDFMERFGTDLPAFGLSCSPLVAGDYVHVQAAASLVKLDKKTGEVLWRALEDGGGMNESAFSSFVLAEI